MCDREVATVPQSLQHLCQVGARVERQTPPRTLAAPPAGPGHEVRMQCVSGKDVRQVDPMHNDTRQRCSISELRGGDVTAPLGVADARWNVDIAKIRSCESQCHVLQLK